MACLCGAQQSGLSRRVVLARLKTRRAAQTNQFDTIVGLELGLGLLMDFTCTPCPQPCSCACVIGAVIDMGRATWQSYCGCCTQFPAT